MKLVEATDEDGKKYCTPLHVAALKGHHLAVESFLGLSYPLSCELLKVVIGSMAEISGFARRLFSTDLFHSV